MAISHKAITCNKPEPDVRELVVQISLIAYLSAAAPSFHALCHRMRDFEIICRNGWTCTGISNNVLQKTFSSYSVTVTVQPDYCFIVEIGGHQLDKCPSITTTMITSLKFTHDSFTNMHWNPDEKFESAQLRRNVKFLNHTGLYMYIITYCKQYNIVTHTCIGTATIAYSDSRLLPLQHSNCSFLVSKGATRCRACE